MRIISGKYKSLKLDGYDIEGIRPTMDKVKESLFAMINDKLYDSICLDLFSGTGSLGIEALSNNAKFVYFVDKMSESIKITEKNLSKLKDNNYKVLNSSYTSALKYFNEKNIKFDIIFLDPPYGKIKIKDLLEDIIKYDLLNSGGVVVCEYEVESLDENYEYLTLIKYRKYGKTYINIYKRGD